MVFYGELAQWVERRTVNPQGTGSSPVFPAKKGNDNMERKYTPHELWDIYMRGKPPKKKETRLQKAIRKARIWAVHLKTLVTRE